jgi:hypothetical protein
MNSEFRLLGGYAMDKLTSTQIGAISANLVANALMVHSRGRLSPFTPVADDDGVDLLVFDKRTGRSLPVQVKSRAVTLKKRGRQERGNLVHFEVRAATYHGERKAYVIFVLLAESLNEIEYAWVIPLHEVRSKGKSRRGAIPRRAKYVLRASRSPKSKDRFREFRCDDLKSMVQRVLSAHGS